MYGKNHPKTFLSVYRQNIAPRISELDIFLKTEEEPYDISDTARLLNITNGEINTIMSVHNIEEINRSTFPVIMKNCPEVEKACHIIQKNIIPIEYEKNVYRCVQCMPDISPTATYSTCVPSIFIR